MTKRESSERPPVVEAFLAKARPGRGPLIAAVDEAIRRVAPQMEIREDGRFLGYGPFHYRYASGREGDTFVVAMMDGAAALSVYVTGGTDGEYLAEQNAHRLGKVSVGKSCIRVKKVGDMDMAVFEELVAAAAAMPR